MIYYKDEAIISLYDFETEEKKDEEKLECSVISKRKDFSLYCESIVDKNNEIVWKNYAGAVSKLITAKSMLNNGKIPFICFNPNDGDYKLDQYYGIIKDLKAATDITFKMEGNNVKEGYVCYLNGNAQDNGTIERIDNWDSLDASRFFIEKNGGYYYRVVNDGELSEGFVTENGPEVILDSTSKEKFINRYIESKELVIPLSNDQACAIFKLSAVPGSFIQVEISGNELKISQIASSIYDKESNSMIIKTMLDLKLKFNSGRRIRRNFDFSDNVIIRVTVRNDMDKTHAPVECSGQGICDRTTGKCNCFDGFSGYTCQRAYCLNNCNGNGRCVPLKELLSNKDLTSYEGFGNSENVYGCLCDKGRRGPDCSLIECPSGKDPMSATNEDEKEYRDCSGRGVCDFTTGICECFEGFSGSGCEIRREYS